MPARALYTWNCLSTAPEFGSMRKTKRVVMSESHSAEPSQARPWGEVAPAGGLSVRDTSPTAAKPGCAHARKAKSRPEHHERHLVRRNDIVSSSRFHPSGRGLAAPS